MADPQTTLMVHGDGSLIPVPVDQVRDYAGLGYRQATPEETAQHGLEEQYSTPGQAAIAGLESAGSALTFGGSSQAEAALGVSPAAMAAREHFNPMASTLGTVAGVAIPSLVSLGGASEFTAPALISKLGGAATRGAGAELPAALSTAGKIARQAVASGLGASAEGAAYGLGNVIHEDALGDPNLTAQSAMSEVGLSALLGGGSGVGLGGSSSALGALADKFTAGDMANKVSSWLGDFEAGRNIKAAGGIQSDIARLSKSKGRDGLMQIAREGGELGLVSPFSSPAQTVERAIDLQQTAGGAMGDLLKDADAQITNEVGPEIDDVVEQARSKVLAKLQGNPLEQGAADEVGRVLDAYEQKFADGMTFSDMHEMRQQLDTKIYGLRGAMDPLSTTLKDSLHDIRGIVSDALKSGLDDVAGLSDEWKTANRQYEVATVFRRLGEKGVDRAVGNNLVSPTEFLGVLSGGLGAGAAGAALVGAGTAAARRYSAGLLGWAAKAMRDSLEGSVASAAAKGVVDASSAPESVAVLSALERARAAQAGKMQAIASTIARGGNKAASVARGEVEAGIANHFGKEDLSAAFDRKSSLIRELASSPQYADATLTKMTDGIHDHAPQTSAAMQAAAARAVSYLAAKLPQHPPGALGPQWKLSPAEQASWLRAHEGASRPLSVLRAAAAGTMTDEGLAAFKAVHPQLYQQAAVALSAAAAQHRESIPYGSRATVSKFLGTDMDGTMNPAFIRAMQLSIAAPETPAQPQSAARAEKITIGQRRMTGTQANSMRER